MNTAVKVQNYTPAQTADMVKRYMAGGTGTESADFDKRDEIVKQLATELKKGERSIRSKLTREKDTDGKQVYIARSTVSKVTGAKPAKKDAMSADLVASAGDTSGVSKQLLNAESIEKMNKPEISILTAQFNALHVEIADLTDTVNDYFLEYGDLPETDVESENQGELTD